MSAVLDELPMVDDEARPPAWRKFAIAAGLLAIVVVLAFWMLKSMGGHSSAPKRQTVKIAVLPDTPPPPPPPKVEPKVEPEKKDIQPQQQPDQPKLQEAPPEPQQLKMDGPAGDGPSAFAAGQVNSEYKGGEIGTGAGGGANKMQFALFTGRLTRHVQAELARVAELKGQAYRVNVRLWLGAGGDVQRVELASSTGDDALDQLLRHSLSRIPALDQVPANLPQPLSLRITNRVTG
jgi:protein TonB